VHDDELESLAEEVAAASGALIGIAVRSVAAAPVPLTVAQHRVLVLLTAEGPRAIGELAQQIGVNPSNATRVCDRLQRLDLVRRDPCAVDRRTVLVSITPTGSRLVEAVLRRRRDEIVAVLGRLAEEDARAVARAVVAFDAASRSDDVDVPFRRL